jgi:hypothetical protein
MISLNVLILHVPTTVLTFGANGDVRTKTFVTAYSIMGPYLNQMLTRLRTNWLSTEKIQMIGFFLQESTLSAIYILETIKILRTSLQPHTRTTMKQLIAINAVIIAMDLGLLGVECDSLYIVETLIKGVIYSIKLKLEYAILSKMTKFVGGTRVSGTNDRKSSVGFVVTDRKSSANGIDSSMNVSEFVNFSKVGGSDFTHPPPRTSVPPQTKRVSPRMAESDEELGEYDFARFRHMEDVSTLGGSGSSGSSRPTSDGRFRRIDSGI